MKSLRTIIVSTLICVSAWSCGRSDEATHFARVEDGKFIVGESTPYYFVGTNFWYGPLLGSPGESGDRERLLAELDRMKSMGIDNLRVLVGAEGPYGKRHKIEPILQPEPGTYDDDLLDGLDYFMAEAGKRGIYVVLYLTNSWEWSGGFGQYLEWAGRGEYPVPGLDGWNPFVDHVKDYFGTAEADSCRMMFQKHIEFIINRENRYTGVKYADDPTIFSWQLCNEPRPFAEENKSEFAYWVSEMAALIKSLDPNHMISTGSEGEIGCQRDIDLWTAIHADPNIDYAVIHAWPYNWRWAVKETLDQSIPQLREMFGDYLDLHLAAIEPLQKPLVLEEFGFPRDEVLFDRGTPTTLKDQFYQYVFELQEQSIRSGGLFAGSNFWGWGGSTQLASGRTDWQPGDEFTVDPAHEPQGFYSVFDDDTTCDIISAAAREINSLRSR